MIESSLTKIHDGLYLSKEGKLYKKIPCEIHLAKDIINEYLALRKELEIVHRRYRDYIHNLSLLLREFFPASKPYSVDYNCRVMCNSTGDNSSIPIELQRLHILISKWIRRYDDIFNIANFQANNVTNLQYNISWRRGENILGFRFNRDIYTENYSNFYGWSSSVEIQENPFFLYHHELLQILEEINKIYPEDTEILKNIENNGRLLINIHREITNINKKIYDIENKTPGIRKQVYVLSSNISTIRRVDLSLSKDSSFSNMGVMSENSNPNNPNGTAHETEISPVYYKRFIEINRELTFEEALALKSHLLTLISDKLYKKYGDKYSLIENNNSILRAKVNNLNREVTDSSWEKLELTITPTIVSATQIDVIISAILFTKSGFTIMPPRKEGIDKYSDNYKALEEYISELITYLKREIPIHDFKLEE